MFFKKQARTENAENQIAAIQNNAFINAMSKFCATISFLPDGTILEANKHFLGAAGYSLEEVIGKKHVIFCPDEVAQSAEYKKFWPQLASGKSQQGTFLRQRKDGSDLWLEATYFPVEIDGKVVKVVKIASDVTTAKETSDRQVATYNAIDRSSATIEFYPDGTIITANNNFLIAVGYSLNEIIGQHHRKFCTDDFYKRNPNFWKDLERGQFITGQFERLNKQGRTVWLEASYNPIFDDKGRVVKVLKVAADITERINKQKAIQDAAEVAHATSIETVQASKDGAKILRRTVETSNQITAEVKVSTNLIEQLNIQSENIAKIVTSIGSIADQTNLLALNAAIEAARAGEYGRGFAVVADEVRTLASRTSTSTIEIEDMVVKNSALTRQAKLSMDNVNERSIENAQLITEASSIIGKIQKGAEHVSTTVSKLIH